MGPCLLPVFGFLLPSLPLPFTLPLPVVALVCVLAPPQKKASSNRTEAAALTSKLLEAAKHAPRVSGKVVNDFGQEEVGVSRGAQKAAMVRDMYANANSTVDQRHEQRVMAMMEARKRARAEMDPSEAKKTSGVREMPAAEAQGLGAMKKSKLCC